MQFKGLFTQSIVCLLFYCISATISSAHQQKEAYITLLFNQKNGSLEVVHRFLLHDAEHIFAQLFDLKEDGLSGDLVVDEASQAAFAKYIEAHFELKSDNGVSLPLKSIGYEVEGKYLWVYQETDMPEGNEIKVKHSALHEHWLDQINHINVERGGEVRSIRLQQSDMNRWRSIKLDESSK